MRIYGTLETLTFEQADQLLLRLGMERQLRLQLLGDVSFVDEGGGVMINRRRLDRKLGEVMLSRMRAS